MSQSDESDDKQFEPSQKKLDDARKKGEIPRSADLNTAASYAGFSLVALSIGWAILSDMTSILAKILGDASSLSADFFSGGQQPILGRLMAQIGWTMLPWFLVPALIVVLLILVQHSFVVVPSKLRPKLSRISVISNAKNKFGRSGLFEFAKSSVKLIIFSGFLGLFLSTKAPEIVMSVNLAPALVTTVMLRLVMRFIFLILLVALVIGAFDFVWQKLEHIRKHRMSRQEVVDEFKQTEGDPIVKQQRRQRAQEIALNKMLSDVPFADVVIVNPTHYAVALKWSRDPGSAPVCVAKGVDEIAARIREIALESAIPIHSDPQTARGLFASIEIGSQIQLEHYAAVAAAIRFAENVREKAKGRKWNA